MQECKSSRVIGGSIGSRMDRMSAFVKGGMHDALTKKGPKHVFVPCNTEGGSDFVAFW